jgi:N-acetylmuramoyl-L-alanine amidase CwlA
LGKFYDEFGLHNIHGDIPSLDISGVPLFGGGSSGDGWPTEEPEHTIPAWSPNCSGRGASITHIVLHNTAGSFNSAVSWLCNPNARASAHVIIGREGQAACIVRETDKAWHAGNGRINACSLGIEIEAYNSARGMTSIQEAKVVAYVRYWMKKYNISAKNIGIHRWYSNTDCPVLIWPSDEEFLVWRNKWFS